MLTQAQVAKALQEVAQGEGLAISTDAAKRAARALTDKLGLKAARSYTRTNGEVISHVADGSVNPWRRSSYPDRCYAFAVLAYSADFSEDEAEEVITLRHPR